MRVYYFISSRIVLTIHLVSTVSYESHLHAL